jgi:hypothetical protein
MFNYVGLFPIISNLGFIAPAIRAYAWGRIFRTFHSALVMFSSGSYHVCKSYFWACLFNYTMEKDFDYVVAVLFLPLDALYFIHFDQSTSYLEWWAILLSTVVVALITTGVASGFIAHAILAGVVAGGVVIYWIVFYWKHGRFPKYNWMELTLGIGCSLFGVGLFVLQDFNPDGYWYIHSLWHLFVSMGRFFIIGIKPAVPLWMNMASRIEYHASGGWASMKNLLMNQEACELEAGYDPARERIARGFTRKNVAQRKTVQS